MPTKIELVLWDIGGPIIKADHALTHHYLCDEHALLEREAIQFFRVPAYLDFARGKIGGHQFAEALRREMAVDLTDAELQQAHDVHMYDVDAETMVLVHQVKARSPFGFLTDTHIWQTRREFELVVLSMLQPKFFLRSNELGYIKADPECFPEVVRRVQVEPRRILLIDDSQEKLARASEHGLRTLQFTSAATLTPELIKLGLI